MKIGLLFFIAIIAALAVLWYRSDPLRIELRDSQLILANKKGRTPIAVEILKKERDMVDEVGIERVYLRFGWGDEAILESIDLDPRHDIGVDDRRLLEILFGKTFKERFRSDGIAIYEGDFFVALFTHTPHDLVLLYPLSEGFAKALEELVRSGSFTPPKRASGLQIEPTQWSPRLIILDGLIRKDI